MSAQQATLKLGTFLGHTDTIWDLQLGEHRDAAAGSFVTSASADGRVGIWCVEDAADQQTDDDDAPRAEREGVEVGQKWVTEGAQCHDATTMTFVSDICD